MALGRHGSFELQGLRVNAVPQQGCCVAAGLLCKRLQACYRSSGRMPLIKDDPVDPI